MMRTYRDIAKEMLELRDMVRELTEERDTLRATVAKLTEELREIGGILGIEDETDKSDPEQVIGQAVVVQCIRRGLVKQRDQLRAQLAEREGYVAVAQGLLFRCRTVTKMVAGSLDQEVTEFLNDAKAIAETQLAERDGQVAALREFVEWLSRHGSLESESEDATTVVERYSTSELQHKDERIETLLADTAQAAAAHDERVRAEERERCINVVQETCKRDHTGAICACADGIGALSTTGKGA